MAKHEVICAVCHQKFDTNSIQAVKYNTTRYAHAECFPTGILVPMEISTPKVEKKKKEKTQEELDKDNLKEYIKQLLGDRYIPQKVNRQIKEFKEQNGYTYTGMKQALVYFYEIQGNDITKAQGGIGIIPYCYTAAYNYYFSIWQAKQQNVNKNIAAPGEEEIFIPRPQVKIKKKNFFSFLDEEE